MYTPKNDPTNGEFSGNLPIIGTHIGTVGSLAEELYISHGDIRLEDIPHERPGCCRRGHEDGCGDVSRRLWEFIVPIDNGASNIPKIKFFQ